jgi:hypothetical protein
MRARKTVFVFVHLAIMIGALRGVAFADNGDTLQPVILRFPEHGETAQSLVPIKLFIPRAELSEKKEDRIVLPRELRQRRAAVPKPSRAPVMTMPRAVLRGVARDNEDEIVGLLDLAPTLGEAVSRGEAVFGGNQGWLARDIFQIRRQRDGLGEQINKANILDQSLRSPFLIQLEDISARSIPLSADRSTPQLSEKLDSIRTLPGLDEALGDF